MDSIIEQLQKEEPLDLKHKDHSLSGNWGVYRECHLKCHQSPYFRKKKRFFYLSISFFLAKNSSSLIIFLSLNWARYSKSSKLWDDGVLLLMMTIGLFIAYASDNTHPRSVHPKNRLTTAIEFAN
ncbi:MULTISPECIES: type II toxin-antitoxin system YafQ family toxin [Legionella]|uniref:type II toxin-antitoxin system YafQ family toxin n=1 Tax=Legionella TaxID=445 RepID=UPI001F5FC055|nr:MULTISPECIES: type II toxin-antitoxin system YafQ family toxin [Legionella]